MKHFIEIENYLKALNVEKSDTESMDRRKIKEKGSGGW